jgi:hypothetical protein
MESIGADRQMQRTPLAASHVQALRDAGKTVTHPVGGEISLLNRGAGSLTMLAVRETRVIEVQRGRMLTIDWQRGGRSRRGGHDLLVRGGCGEI